MNCTSNVSDELLNDDDNHNNIILHPSNYNLITRIELPCFINMNDNNNKNIEDLNCIGGEKVIISFLKNSNNKNSSTTNKMNSSNIDQVQFRFPINTNTTSTATNKYLSLNKPNLHSSTIRKNGILIKMKKNKKNNKVNIEVIGISTKSYVFNNPADYQVNISYIYISYIYINK